jgi:hypothetical protein
MLTKFAKMDPAAQAQLIADLQAKRAREQG